MPWAYFKVIGLFHIKFLKNGVWYGKRCYRLLIGHYIHYTVAFDWCHFWWPWSTFWRSFQPRLSFPRPFQQSLACFRVERSPGSSSWASCSTYKPPYFRNNAKNNAIIKGHYWILTGNRIRALDWYRNQWPWMTLNWPWTVIMRFFTVDICLSEPTTKNMNENSPILSAPKICTKDWCF